MHKFRFEAHRGVGTEFPENTLPAFEAAVNLGYDVIELDPKFTSDDACVILHDRSVGRTGRNTDGSPVDNTAIAELTLAQVRALDFGLWKHERFVGTVIPTLDETLDFAASHNIALKFDNVFESFTPRQREIFYSTIENARLGSKIGFTCAKPETFAEFASRLPDCELHYDGAPDDDRLDAARSFGHRLTVWTPYPNGYASWVKDQRTSPEFCEHLHLYGEVGLWLLKLPDELEAAKNIFKADIIETDGSVKP